jgi:hypothetical protein
MATGPISRRAGSELDFAFCSGVTRPDTSEADAPAHHTPDFKLTGRTGERGAWNDIDDAWSSWWRD